MRLAPGFWGSPHDPPSHPTDRLTPLAQLRAEFVPNLGASRKNGAFSELNARARHLSCGRGVAAAVRGPLAPARSGR